MASTFGSLPNAARLALAEVMRREDPDIVGIVLTGSAARGMATQFSDVDVMIVREDQKIREVSYSVAIDEIPITLVELETIRPVGSEGAGDRWSFAWAQVLRDSCGGRVTRAVQRQATLSDQEVQELLLGRGRLDEFINLVYRALKSHRDGRPEVARLDSAESVASMLDITFALAGRVRPYNKYLAWELREHPLPGPGDQSDGLLRRVYELLEGSEDAARKSFLVIEEGSRAFDRRLGQDLLSKVIDAWGEELSLLRRKPTHSQTS